MRPSTVTLIGILACVLFAAWFYTTHEKVTTTEYTGYSGEARFNHFFAAEMLLNRLEIEADSHASLTPSDWLPETSDTIVAHLSPTIAVELERALLLGWIGDGGHLVLMPARVESDMAEGLAEELGFGFLRLDPDEMDSDRESEEDDAGGADEEDATIDEIMRYWQAPHRITLYDEIAYAATLEDEDGIIAARRQWGNGFVTLIANAAYFSNDHLDEAGNAELLLNAVDGYVEPGKIWLIFGAAFPSLWQVIWSAAPWVVIAGAILLLAWIWSVVPRFGPPVTVAPPVRRSIVEHVRAAGHFVWRNHGAAVLASSSAAAVLHEAEARHPGIGRLSAERQAQQIAKMTDLPAQAILDVLVNQGEPRHREFTQNMRALQRIRNEL